MTLITHEIGSMAKPSWRIKALSGAPLQESDIEEAKRWGERLEIPHDELLTLLAKKGAFTAAEKAHVQHFASLYATKLLEKAGLDLVWDGEQHRVEMYEYPVRRMNGFVFHGSVRSFDNKYYDKASCVEVPSLEKPYHVEEYERIAKIASKPIKIPITGAYTLMDWSYDEHYLAAVAPGMAEVAKLRHNARSQFLSDLTLRVVRPNIQALYEKGVRYIQIDEPAATTKRDETLEFVNSVRESIGDLAGKAFFSMHICFSDYARLFPAIHSLQGVLDELHFEYANRDSKELGLSAHKRQGYELLKLFKGSTFKIGLGVLDVHTDYIEPPELIRDRILYASSIVEDPLRLFIAPDCGLRTRTWEVTFAKLKNMVEGRNLAAKSLGI